jgi:hypothetical protein
MDSNQYFSYIVPKLLVKSIVFANTPEGCLSANTIRKKLIQEGHQVIPELMYPNMVKVSYLEKSKNSEIFENDQKNMIFAEPG